MKLKIANIGIEHHAEYSIPDVKEIVAFEFDWNAKPPKVVLICRME